MLLGRVTGTVVASQKEPLMDGLTMLVVRQLGVDNTETGGYVVAVDAVGAGVGEVVMYATGSSARQTGDDPEPSVRRRHHGDRRHLGESTARRCTRSERRPC